jgi:hypothetical protein
MICRLAAAAAVLHLVAGAPALPLPLQKYKRVVTPNNQHETLDGIGIPIGILGVKTRVSVEGGVVSVPLWGVSGPNSRDVRQGKQPSDCSSDARRNA